MGTLFLVTPRSFFLLPKGLGFVFFRYLRIPSRHAGNVILLCLSRVTTLRLAIRVRDAVNQGLDLSFFRFAVASLRSVFRDEGLPRLAVKGVRGTTVLRTRVFFPTVMPKGGVGGLHLVRPLRVRVRIRGSN